MTALQETCVQRFQRPKRSAAETGFDCPRGVGPHVGTILPHSHDERWPPEATCCRKPPSESFQTPRPQYNKLCVPARTLVACETPVSPSITRTYFAWEVKPNSDSNPD